MSVTLPELQSNPYMPVVRNFEHLAPLKNKIVAYAIETLGCKQQSYPLQDLSLGFLEFNPARITSISGGAYTEPTYVLHTYLTPPKRDYLPDYCKINSTSSALTAYSVTTGPRATSESYAPTTTYNIQTRMRVATPEELDYLEGQLEERALRDQETQADWDEAVKANPSYADRNYHKYELPFKIENLCAQYNDGQTKYSYNFADMLRLTREAHAEKALAEAKKAEQAPAETKKAEKP